MRCCRKHRMQFAGGKWHESRPLKADICRVDMAPCWAPGGFAFRKPKYVGALLRAPLRAPSRAKRIDPRLGPRPRVDETFLPCRLQIWIINRAPLVHICKIVKYVKSLDLPLLISDLVLPLLICVPPRDFYLERYANRPRDWQSKRVDNSGSFLSWLCADPAERRTNSPPECLSAWTWF